MDQLETNDLFKGAYFLSQLCRLKETRFQGHDRIVFVFEGEGRNLPDLDQHYHSGHALVNPLDLRKNLDFLRDIMRTTFRLNRTQSEIRKGENNERTTQGVDR